MKELKNKPSRRRPVAITTVGWALLFALSADGATYTVKAGGGGNYTTIQACAATMSPGDTCTVFAGTYHESVTVTAGSSGAIKTLNVNGSDLVYVLSFTLNSYTQINGFQVQNPSSPSAAPCVLLPASATNVYITNNTFYACGASSMIAVCASCIPYPEYVYVTGNTFSYPGSTSIAPNVTYAIVARGDHWLIENNDISHSQLGIDRTGSYGIVINNIYHDNYGADPLGILPQLDCVPGLSASATVNGNTITWISGDTFYRQFPGTWVDIGGSQYTITSVPNSTTMTVAGAPPQGPVSLTGGQGGNCHMNFYFDESSLTSRYNVVEGNTIRNSLGNDNHCILAQANACGGNCDHLIVRYNIAEHVGSGGIIDDNASDHTDPGFAYVKSYNNTWADTNNYSNSVRLYGGTNGFTNNSIYGSDMNDLFYYPESLASFNPYYSDSSTISTFSSGYNLAYCTASPCNLEGKSYNSGSFAGDPGNKVAAPTFVNYTANNFSLSVGSPAIGAGTYLTTVAAGDSGSGTSLVLNDVSYFQDGYGLSGVNADCISVTKVTNYVCITSVNYSANSLTLASGITRSAGDSVWLYSGSTGRRVLLGNGPNIGATFAAPPAPPSGLTTVVH